MNPQNGRYIVYQNRRLNLSQWAEELKISRVTLQSRLKRGWSVERAFSTPGGRSAGGPNED